MKRDALDFNSLIYEMALKLNTAYLAKLAGS